MPAGAPVIGVSRGHRELAEADHWILSLVPAPVLACTHLVREPFPHVAISLVGAAASAAAGAPIAARAATTAPGGGLPAGLVAPAGAQTVPETRSIPETVPALETQPSLQAAADLAVAGRSGRAVLFPGVANLVGTLSVADVLALSAIDRIEILGGEVPDPAALVETNDFVRPQYRAGQLILTVMPAVDGRLVPFESRTPTPCCAAH